jgi:hypothetical protein
VIPQGGTQHAGPSQVELEHRCPKPETLARNWRAEGVFDTQTPPVTDANRRCRRATEFRCLGHTAGVSWCLVVQSGNLCTHRLRVRDAGAAGSNPVIPTSLFNGLADTAGVTLAQPGAHLARKPSH